MERGWSGLRVIARDREDGEHYELLLELRLGRAGARARARRRLTVTTFDKHLFERVQGYPVVVMFGQG